MATPLHLILSDKIMELMRQGAHRAGKFEKVSNNTLIQVDSDSKSFQVNGEIFISSADIYDGLSGNAIRLVIDIQKELAMNNPLWEFTQKSNQRMRSALAELKRKDIVEAIAGTDMFLVNPTKIRKGKPLTIYGALLDYSRRMYNKDKNWKPTNEDIKRFKAPDNLTILSPALLLQGNS